MTDGRAARGGPGHGRIRYGAGAWPSFPGGPGRASPSHPAPRPPPELHAIAIALGAGAVLLLPSLWLLHGAFRRAGAEVTPGRSARPSLPRAPISLPTGRPPAAGFPSLLVTVSPRALGFSGSHAAVAGHIAFAMAFGPIAVLVSALPAAALSTAPPVGGVWLVASPWCLGTRRWASVHGAPTPGRRHRPGRAERRRSPSRWTALTPARRAGDHGPWTGHDRRSPGGRRPRCSGQPPSTSIDTLTDTDACARWSPVPFAVEGWRQSPLGTRGRSAASPAACSARRCGFTCTRWRPTRGGCGCTRAGPSRSASRTR